MCETASSCQVDSKQRIHAVRFSETLERIELGAIRSAFKTSSTIRADSFTRRGILSKTRLTAPLDDHSSYKTEHEQDDCTVRSSSAPTTSIALVHKDSIELILKRGISMTSKSSGGGFLSTSSKNLNKEASPTKWKMKFWMPKRKDEDSDNIPGQSKKGTGLLQLLSESEILNVSSMEENESPFETSSLSEENNEDNNFIPEEYESSIDFQNSKVDSQSVFYRVNQPSVAQEEESDGDEEDSKILE